MSSGAVDLFLIYQFIKRLATPFEKWDAFKYGIIDKDGKVLRKKSTLKTTEEKNAWGNFDILVANLKKLLGKVPGGKTRLASYAAALLLLKEHNIIDTDNINEEYLLPLLEAEIANVAGSGAIEGMGVGPKGEPGKTTKNTINLVKKVMKRRAPNNVI